MFPVICKIGPLTVFSYGLMIAVAIVVCTLLLIRDASKENIEQSVIFDLVFWVVLGGILGARLFYILLNFDFYFQDPLEIIMLQHGGLAWQGGLVSGALSAVWFIIKRRQLSLPKMLDLSAPYIALGQSIGRAGCFLNGCCYGRPVHWGIFFPVHQDHLHPTQLYSTFGLFVIFLILKSFQKRIQYQGQVFVMYLCLAAALRFFIEFFRADHYVSILGLSIYQLVCIGLFILGLYVHTRFKSRFRS